ncbi:MAG: glycosyltransferase family 39 protein [Chloroflexia bacterium]
MMSKEDARNLVMLVLGVLLVLILVPPVRTFPMTDDWIYSRSVSDLLTWNYHPPEQAQANLLSHVVWGALFVAVFGQSFTVLSVATLVASIIGLAGFYLLLRHLSVSPNAALLGMATLGFNPLYVYLSYTFMTDVTFLTCWILASLFYVRGFQGSGDRWLWLGSIMTSIAYLARQPGAILIVAALAYLFWSRRWTWRSAIAIAAAPLLVAISFSLWERTQPPNFLPSMVSGIVADPLGFLLARAPFIGLVITPVGLFIAPILTRPRRVLLALPTFVILSVLIFVNTHYNGSAFPPNGNVLDHRGFVMFYYNAAPIWSEPVWAVIGIGSAFILSLYVAALIERALQEPGLRQRFGRHAGPAWMLYVLAVLMAGLVIGIIPLLFDRYMLPILPLLMIPALRRIGAMDQANNKLASGVFLRWVTVGVLATFSIVCMRDYMEHARVRWEAANRLVERGTPGEQIDAGLEWQGLYWKQSSTHNQPSTARSASGIAIFYKVSDLLVDGYTAIDSLPYKSWLSGGEARHVWLLRRK